MSIFTLSRKAKALLLCTLVSGAISTESFAQPVASLVVGTGTTASSGTPMPYYTGWWGNKNQYLVLASELIAQGAIAGNIASIGFEVTTAGGLPMNNFTVKIGPSSLTALTTAWVTTGLTQVYTTTVLNPVANSVNVHNFTSPYYWDGVSNILIETCFNNSSWSGAHTVKYSTTTFNASHYVYDDLSTVCSAPNTGYTSTMRPNIHFEFIVPPNNAGVAAITAPASNAFCSGVNEVKARVHNYGSNVIDNVTVNWSVNGVLQTPVNYTTAIDMENTPAGPDAIVTLGNVNFPYNVNQKIDAWTSMPNGVADTKPSNDSVKVNIMAELLGINDFLISPQDTVICSGSEIVLNAGVHPKDPIYIWSNGMLTQTNSVSTEGAMSVKVQNTDGCFAIDTIHVDVHPYPVANSIAIIDNGDCSFTFNVIGAQNADTYTWDFGDSNGASGEGSKTHSYASNGTYTAVLKLSNQCGDLEITRIIECVKTSTGINGVEGLASDLKLYPNPGKDKVTLSYKGSLKLKSIEVYNLVGQRVYSVKPTGGATEELNVSSLAAGIYNVVIDTDEGKATKKLEVIK